jgi:anti-anti-sigma factor
MSRISVEQEDNTTTITVQGDFVFDVNREFRDAYQASPPTNAFVVDLKDTAYMDSAGLGMLIQLRDFAGGQAASIRLVGLNDTIRTILNVANFSRLFELG